MERNNSNDQIKIVQEKLNENSEDQIKIDQKTLNENSEDQITIDQETLDKYINDLNLASLLKKICSKKRFEQLQKIQNYSIIIEDLNYFGRKELAEIFLNLPLESLKALSEINFPWSIIQNLNKSGRPELVKKFFKLDPSSLARITYSIISGLNKRELVEEFLNLDLNRLAELSKFENLHLIIKYINEYGGKELVEKFLNFDLNRLAELSKFENLYLIIKYINQSGGKELVEKFLNFDLERLAELSKINPLCSIITSLNNSGGKELVEKFLNFDLDRLERLSKFTFLNRIIKDLNNSGGKELVEKFLNLDLKSLNFLSYSFNELLILENNTSPLNLLIKFIDSDYHEFFKTLLSQEGNIDKKGVLSNFLITCCNFNPESKIDSLFKFIKRNKDNKRNLNIFPFILGNIEFFKDNIITIENLDNIINQFTKDSFKTFFDKEKIKNYIEQNPIFELIKHDINYNENTSIDNLIEIYLNELFNEQKCKDKKNTTILDKSLKDLIEASGISEEYLNNLIFESDILTLLNTLKNFKDPYLNKFISNAINDRTTLDMIQKDINSALKDYKESGSTEKNKYFIQNIIATILFSPFILNIKFTIPKEIQSLEIFEEIQSLEFNEFLKEIVRPIFKEAGINSEEDLLNFICEIENLNEEDKINLINNKEIIPYLQKIFDLFKQETNMDVDSTQQVSKNNAIGIQNQISN